MWIEPLPPHGVRNVEPVKPNARIAVLRPQ
jgi:hypothetical protein